MFNRIAVVVVSGGLLAGCATQQQNNTAIGAGAGAAVGAGLGALIGNGKGAAIGAGIGAVAGGLVGYNWKVVKDDVQKSGASSLGIDVVEMPDGSLKVNIPSNVSFDTDKTQLAGAAARAGFRGALAQSAPGAARCCRRPYRQHRGDGA